MSQYCLAYRFNALCKHRDAILGWHKAHTTAYPRAQRERSARATVGESRVLLARICVNLERYLRNDRYSSCVKPLRSSPSDCYRLGDRSQRRDKRKHRVVRKPEIAEGLFNAVTVLVPLAKAPAAWQGLHSACERVLIVRLVRAARITLTFSISRAARIPLRRRFFILAETRQTRRPREACVTFVRRLSRSNDLTWEPFSILSLYSRRVSLYLSLLARRFLSSHLRVSKGRHD